MITLSTLRLGLILLVMVASISSLATILVGVSAAPAPGQSASQGEKFTFAVIGDYGWEGQAEADVARLVRGWRPDLVITTGDNNYSDGASSTIDKNIGQYYASFIAPYNGRFGPGATGNHFFPSLGNHDWERAGARPYLAYFTLPGNERYYDFTSGPVQFFALDSDIREPDGITVDSRQAEWLRAKLETSNSAWRVVYLHHPPFSSGIHGNTLATQWPYEDWGSTAVLAGHDHSYERLQLGGIPYFVNGLGGAPSYGFLGVVEGSRKRYAAGHGAMLVQAQGNVITYSFYTTKNVRVDTFRQCREREWGPGIEGCLAGAWGGRTR